MKFTKTRIKGLFIIEPRFQRDERGFFMEFYNKRDFESHGIHADFVQDNLSGSSRGVLRGLHYQKGPAAQGKLVRVARGEIYDVVVDMRSDSPTFGQWMGEFLSADNQKMICVPPGFAHGFCVMEDKTEVLYKVTAFYSPADEGGVLWSDPTLAITWPDLGTDYIISPRDRKNPTWNSIRQTQAL